MSRACDAIGCNCQTATGRFMCPRHWRCVPLELQRIINRQFRLAKTRHALMHDPIYVEACAKAVEQLAEADGKPTENSYRRLLTVLQRRDAEPDQEPASVCAHCGKPVLPGQAYNGATKNHWDCDPRTSTKAVIEQLDTAIEKAHGALARLSKVGRR